MTSPLSFLVEHENTILKAYRENSSKPGQAWTRLEKDLPGLAQSMTFNTFKQYVTVFAFVKAELDKVRQNEAAHKLDSLENEKKQLEKELRITAHRLDKVTQNRNEILKKLDAKEAEGRINAKEKDLGLI